MRVLFLSRWFPYPPSNGSQLRIYHLLRGLAQRHEVTLLSFTDQPDLDRGAPALRSICRDVQVVPWKPFDTHSWRTLVGFFSLKPRSAVDTFSPEMQHCIAQALSTTAYDVIIASQIDMAVYSPHFCRVSALFEEAEIGVLYEQFSRARSVWHRFRYGLTWLKYQYYLPNLLQHFRACTVVSEPERRLLTQVAPGFQMVEVIPNAINLGDYMNCQAMPQPNQLIFTGSIRYFANHDAMVWFLQQVYPLIQAAVPDVQLIITGDHADLPLPPANHVTLTGFVENIRPLISSACISLAPIRLGGGTRLKILEAMALHTPVVATSKGVEGLDAQHGQHLLIADTPETFAEAVIRLLKDPALSQQLADAAYQLVRDKYDWAVVMPRFMNLVERLAHPSEIL